MCLSSFLLFMVLCPVVEALLLSPLMHKYIFLIFSLSLIFPVFIISIYHFVLTSKGLVHVVLPPLYVVTFDLVYNM